MLKVHKGQVPSPTARGKFRERFMQSFYDPAFAAEQEAIDRLEAIAWEAFDEGRKAPRSTAAGKGYADPTYELSDEWRETSEKLKAAQKKWARKSTPSRVLVVCGSPRNDGTCPGEISKTWRMSKMVRDTLSANGMEVDLLDLSRVTSEYDLHIHPCKGCVSTAMPLCHWPCSCYPNHADRQINDWMADIYERWVAAHGVIILTPVHWYQATSPLKLMIDRLVCADGGNPDPTSTQGKKPGLAKQIEQKGWDYPKHLEGRAYGVVVHGDVAGIEGVRRALCDWLDWMGLVDAGSKARLDRFIGYYESYADSHTTYEKDKDVQEEIRNVARAVAEAVKQLRAGKLSRPDGGVKPPRVK